MVEAVVAAAIPFATQDTATTAPKAPPAVATTATAHATTIAAPSAQCHHSQPDGSRRTTGLFAQYAHILPPSTPCPVVM